MTDKTDLQAIVQVGPIRAMRIKRDLGFETIPEVANASREELTGVWSVGLHTAGRIKGSAQGLRNTLPSERPPTAVETAIEPKRNPRVALVVGNDVSNGVQVDGDEPDVESWDGARVHELVDETMERLQIDLDEPIDFGIVTDGMGGDLLRNWVESKWSVSDRLDSLSMTTFDTPWDAYDSSKNNTLPDDSVFDYSVYKKHGLQSWMAPVDRTQKLLDWADAVVVPVTGDYIANLIDECIDRDLPYYVGDNRTKLPTPDDPELYGQKDYSNVSDEETRANRPSRRVPEHVTTDEDGDDEDEPENGVSVDVFINGEDDGPSDEPNTPKRPVKTGQKAREGTPEDLDTLPEGATYGIVADEESRLDRTDLDGADPGGKGMERWVATKYKAEHVEDE